MVCMHSGQGCAITTRLLLPRSRYDEGVEIVEGSRSRSFPYGDPTDIGNMAGPLINARQRERVLGYIEKGKAEGAQCIVGGGRRDAVRQGLLRPADAVRRRRPRLDDRAGGDLRPGARRSSRTRTTTTRCASPTTRATGCRARSRASRSTARWRSPAASAPARSSVNGGLWFGPDSPFGGYKESGLGREHGVQGFEEYLETKTIGLPALAPPTGCHAPTSNRCARRMRADLLGPSRQFAVAARQAPRATARISLGELVSTGRRSPMRATSGQYPAAMIRLRRRSSAATWNSSRCSCIDWYSIVIFHCGNAASVRATKTPFCVVDLELQDQLGKAVRAQRLEQQRLHLALGWRVRRDSTARARCEWPRRRFSPRRACRRKVACIDVVGDEPLPPQPRGSRPRRSSDDGLHRRELQAR